MKYIANFGEEIGGEEYAPGALITPTEDTEDTLKVLATMGRVTPVEDGDPKVPATGADTAKEAPVANPDGLDDQTVPELRDTAQAENIDLGDAAKKADIIAAIRAARAG